MGVVEALGLGVAAGRGAERKQARTIATVAADRDPVAHDHAETVAQRMQPLDRRVRVVHHAERVAGQLERARVQSRPFRDAGAHQPMREPLVAPLAIRGIDRICAALAGIKPRDQCADDRALVLLHEIPQLHVDRHAASLNPGDGLGAVVAPVHDALRDRRARDCRSR